VSAWLVYPEDENRRYSWFQTDDAGKAAFLARWAAKLREFAYASDGIPAIRIDSGGAVTDGEPEVGWMAAGTLIQTFMRHLPFVLETLERAKANDKVPGCIAFSGFVHTYILGEETRRAALREGRRVLAICDEQAKALEREHARCVNQGPHTVYRALCSCLSGQPFVECCGRTASSPSQANEAPKTGQEK
jgi:hypothetical protein